MGGIGMNKRQKKKTVRKDYYKNYPSRQDKNLGRTFLKLYSRDVESRKRVEMFFAIKDSVYGKGWDNHKYKRPLAFAYLLQTARKLTCLKGVTIDLTNYEEGAI